MRFCAPSAFEATTIASESAVPSTLSVDRLRRTKSASIVLCWSRDCVTAVEPKATTPIWSELRFEFRNCFTACAAWARGAPCIDFERSIASMIALLSPSP